MEGLLLILLLLACPLGMTIFGVGAWLVARARGQKKELSVGCMPMPAHGRDEQQSHQAERAQLRQEIDQLRQEVQTLQEKSQEAKR